MKISPLSEHLGAEVTGIDVKALDDAGFDRVYDAWLAHQVLVIRDQQLDDTSLTAFSARFGPLEERPLAGMTEEEKHRLNSRYVTVISNILEDGKPLGALANKEANWHSDMTYRPVPPTASLLYAVELPSTGGDTHFASQYAALEATPQDMRKRLEGVSIKHDATHTSVGDLRYGFEELSDPREIPGAAHPPLSVHPETGKPCLYLGRRDHAYVLDMSLEDSERLLDEAWQYAAQPEYCYTHQWSLGDVVIWDNRCVLHKRDGFDAAQRRMMRRCQVLARSGASA
jgi:taurine dioxygenase